MLMCTLAKAAFAALALAIVPGLAGGEPLNLLVMGEDADLDTIERHTPIFDRVVQAISGELRARGFNVYDETAVTMEFYDLGRVRRPDAELISLARSVQLAPIDAVTAFEIHAATVPSVYEGITELRLRIAGRVIEIRSGLSLGGYEVSYRPGDLPPLPLDCDRGCQIAFVGDQAARIAGDVGAALAAQLAQLAQGAARPPGPPAIPGCSAPPTAFTLTFNGFTPQELARFDAVLAAFRGYAHHHPLLTDAATPEIRYETCADADRLERNLRAMFEQAGAEVWLEEDDHGFFASQIAAPAAQHDQTGAPAPAPQ